MSFSRKQTQPITFLENHRSIVVCALLVVMFLLGLGAMVGDSAIVDEIAHIPAGYSYLAYHDFRLNPEHPPLIKDLAGIPLLFLSLRFPADNQAWTHEVNGQWEAGWHFLYHHGNNADLILFWSRLPILLLSVLFGVLLYVLTRKFSGTAVALLALFFYALSPNFLAHSHFVTTDLGIAAFTFLALATLALFLKKPSWQTLLLASVSLALAQLTKFSAILLIPFYFGILVLHFITTKTHLSLLDSLKLELPIFRKKIFNYGVAYTLLILGSLVIIWLFYGLHTYNFPADKQIELIKVSLPDQRADPVRNILTAMSHNPILQALAQYLLGVSMVFSRVAGGNTTYFLGEVTNQSFKWYFPVTYLLKTPISFLVLLCLTIVISFKKLYELSILLYWQRFKKFATAHIEKIIYLLFILYYAGISISGNLNLGIRHLFPILPLIYILVADSTLNFLRQFSSALGKKIAYMFLGVLLVWFAGSSLAAFPHYLSYFNEIIGGGKNAYLYFTDSNVDWGQDLKRLVSWVRQRPEIKELKLDYFGGGEPKYYFCKRLYDAEGTLVRTSKGYDCSGSVYREYHVNDGPTTGWIAVSVTFLQNAKFYAQKNGQPDYDWLRFREPVAKIGNSIFVYKVE